MMGVTQYRQVDAAAMVEDASPHRLIQLMFEGLMARLSAARGQIMRRDIPARAKSIGSAVAILGGLQQCLDEEKGGDLSRNLRDLYEYAQQRLYRANVDNDVAALDEVVDLLGRIKSAWDEIKPEARS